tara:strand:+ start:1959 stop:2363 length:405 start_codon:yes stop_codon:yes gene_type:complete
LIKNFLTLQFNLFLIAGGIAALINFSSRIILNFWLNFSLSIIFAYIIGMVTFYLLAKTFVFKGSNQSYAKSIFYFVCVNILAVSQTWLISIGLANYFFPEIGLLKFQKEIAHGIGVLVPVFTSYFGHKYFSFSK